MSTAVVDGKVAFGNCGLLWLSLQDMHWCTMYHWYRMDHMCATVVYGESAFSNSSFLWLSVEDVDWCGMNHWYAVDHGYTVYHWDASNDMVSMVYG